MVVTVMVVLLTCATEGGFAVQVVAAQEANRSR